MQILDPSSFLISSSLGSPCPGPVSSFCDGSTTGSTKRLLLLGLYSHAVVNWGATPNGQPRKHGIFLHFCLCKNYIPLTSNFDLFSGPSSNF